MHSLYYKFEIVRHMIKLRSTAKPKPDMLLPEGDHLVGIDEITETFNKDWASMPWDDKTPQVAIKFKNARGFITLWVNCKGYMTIEDYEDTHSAELSGIIFKAHPSREQVCTTQVSALPPRPLSARLSRCARRKESAAPATGKIRRSAP